MDIKKLSNKKLLNKLWSSIRTSILNPRLFGQQDMALACNDEILRRLQKIKWAEEYLKTEQMLIDIWKKPKKRRKSKK